MIDVRGTPLIVYNLHPTHPGMTGEGFFRPAYRRREIEELLARAAKEKEPVILAGDFNMTDLTEDYGRIAAQYHDAYRQVGWGMGFTFPDQRYPNALSGAPFNRELPFPPWMRLDYVFYSAPLRAAEAHVWPDSGGSDHRPLWVRLALPAR